MLALASTLACGHAFSPAGVAGTYTLQTFDGEPLPVVVATTIICTATEPIVVTTSLVEASLTLRSDQQFMRAFVLVADDGTTVSPLPVSTSLGTYSLVEPNTIQLNHADSEVVVTGAVEGNRITFTDDGVTFVYER